MQKRNPGLRLAPTHEPPADLAAPRPFSQTIDKEALAAVARACTATVRQFGEVPLQIVKHAPLFSPRDAHFIVALSAEDDPVYLVEQILCLAALASRRGLPRNVLETHLRTLADAVDQLPVSNWLSGSGFIDAAEELRVQREEILPNDRRRTLIDAFSKRALAEDDDAVAWYLTAAMADEANGIRGAVPAVLRWMDKRRPRDDAWKRAVREMISSIDAAIMTTLNL